MKQQFSVEQQPERPVLYIRTTTTVANLKNALADAYGRIIAYIGTIGGLTEGPAYAAYYNMDMQHLEVEMGFVVVHPLKGAGDIVAGSVPAGAKAVATHTGPYTTMEKTYAAMTAWMQANNLHPTGLVYEFYHNGPQEVPESQLRTTIEFPLA